MVTIERVEAGSFLGPSGRAELLADWSRPGHLVVGVSRFGRGPGVTGRGEVARIRFKARRGADAPFALAAIRALSPRLDELSLRIDTASIRPEIPPRPRPPQAP